MENNNLKVEDKVEGEIYSTNPPKAKNTLDSRKKAIIIAAVSTALSIAVIAVLIVVFVFNYTFPVYLLTYKNISDLQIEYKLDSTYSYVENINYEDYLEDVQYKEKVAIYISHIPGICEDAKTNGELLNALMHNISLNDGGLVVFDVSIKTTPIILCDDIEIVVEKDVVIELPTYEYMQANNIQYLNNALFYAKDVENIRIYGPGKLNGNGVSYTLDAIDSTPFMPLETFNLEEKVTQSKNRIRPLKDEHINPSLINLVDCEDIEIKNIVLENSASSSIVINECDDVKIENVVITNNLYVQNADGIDIISSQNVDVYHCFIATSADGVSIKANGEEESKNIKVNRCSIMSLANNFKIGDETSKDISNISLVNSYFFVVDIAGGYCGIAIQSVDGSNIYDVYVDNICMDKVPSPLLIWLGNRLDVKNGSIGKVGSIKNLSISNIKCTDVEMATAVIGCSIDKKSYYVQDLRLANFDVKYRQAAENLNMGDVKLEDSINGYPEIINVLLSQDNKYYDMPVYGIFARHVKGFKVINYKVEGRNNTTQQKDNITQENARYDTEKVFLR